MENSIIDKFKGLQEDLEQKGYTKQQQLSILIPLFENILDSMQDLLKSETDKYNDFFAYAGTIRTASRFTSGHSAGVDSDSQPIYIRTILKNSGWNLSSRNFLNI